MAEQYRTITYTDELLPDNSVRRHYSNGRDEWRRLLPDGRVEWEDTQGNSGVDEMLGDGIIKRTLADGQVLYARDQGYGRTAWRIKGKTVLMVNQTSFGGKVGAVLTGLGAGALLGGLTLPPESLTLEEEEALRRQRDSSGDTGGGDYDYGDDDIGFDDAGVGVDFAGDADFG